MSRAYGMLVDIRGQEPSRVGEIKQAAEEEWPFGDWSDFEGELTAYAEDQLCGGETEEDFTRRLTVAIWKANGDYCKVSVDATYMESLPYETHCLNEDDYQRLMENSNANEHDDANG
jgi:hypothetical protein